MNIDIIDIITATIAIASLVSVWYKAPQEKRKSVSSAIDDYAKVAKTYMDEAIALKKCIDEQDTEHAKEKSDLTEQINALKAQIAGWNETMLECTRINMALKKYIGALVAQLKSNNIIPVVPDDLGIGDIELW